MSRFPLIALATILCLCVVTKSLEAAPKPNIVHIMADDLGWQDIASHKVDGKPVYETPHLDRLTKMGRRFTQAYSPAPTCSPSRASFLRGQYPAHTGVYHVMGGRMPRRYMDAMPYFAPHYLYGLPKEEPILPTVLKKAGYVSGQVGKWHVGGKSAGYPFPLDMGFDFGFSEQGGRRKYYNDPELWGKDRIKDQFFGSWARMKPDRLSDFATDAEDDPYQVDKDGRPFDKPLDLAIGFMRQHKDRPFFLNYCTYLVHGPIGTRDRKRFELYCEKMGYDFPTDPGIINKGKTGQTNPYYAGMVDSLDWMVGEILEYLETTEDPRNPGHKLIDNTYIFFDSDNGGWVGSPGHMITDNSPLRGGKMQTYEGGIRIPFLVCGPSVEAGTECDTPINLIDLFPTFMGIAGLGPDESLDLDGCNILPLIFGETNNVFMADGSQRESLFWYYPVESHMSAVVRKGSWKLVRNFGVGMSTKEGYQLFKLYDEDGLANDLSEKRNLAEQEPRIRDALVAELNAHLTKAGVLMPYRNAHTKSNKALAAKSPKVLGLGSEEDRVWAEFETGDEKASITEAFLLYTMNPSFFDSTGHHREEWFRQPATLTGGRVEAAMPPGATHAAFCMRDSNEILITSEPMPSWREVNQSKNDSELLEDGFAYKPGLWALIELGELAKASAVSTRTDTNTLQMALTAAKKVYSSEDATDEVHANAIRALRGAIRAQSGAPQASNPYLNRFPTEPLF